MKTSGVVIVLNYDLPPEGKRVYYTQNGLPYRIEAGENLYKEIMERYS